MNHELFEVLTAQQKNKVRQAALKKILDAIDSTEFEVGGKMDLGDLVDWDYELSDMWDDVKPALNKALTQSISKRLNLDIAE